MPGARRSITGQFRVLPAGTKESRPSPVPSPCRATRTSTRSRTAGCARAPGGPRTGPALRPARHRLTSRHSRSRRPDGPGADRQPRRPPGLETPDQIRGPAQPQPVQGLRRQTGDVPLVAHHHDPQIVARGPWPRGDGRCPAGRGATPARCARRPAHPGSARRARAGPRNGCPPAGPHRPGRRRTPPGLRPARSPRAPAPATRRWRAPVRPTGGALTASPPAAPRAPAGGSGPCGCSGGSGGGAGSRRARRSRGRRRTR
jgi:hypothetical protein